MEQIAEAPAPEQTPAPAPMPEAKAPETESPGEKAAREDKALDDDLRKVFRKANREQPERGDDGKFLGKEPKTEAPKLPDAKLPADPKQADAKTPAAPVVAVPPPQAWKAEDKAKWSTLPPDVQKIVAAREAEAHKAISDLGQHKAVVESLQKIFEPHRTRIPQGVTEGQYVNQLLHADAELTRDPIGFIKQIADHYQVDLNSLASDPYAYADPQSAQLQHQLRAATAKIEQMERQLGEVGHRVIGRERAEQEAQQAEYTRTIEAFFADKPDVEHVRDDVLHMAASVLRANPKANPTELLQQAYDRAIWANPITRKAQLERQAADAEKKRIADAQAAADKARRAGSINVRGSPNPVNGSTSLDDDLRAVWRKNHAA